MADNIVVNIEAVDKFSNTFAKLQAHAEKLDSANIGDTLISKIRQISVAVGGAAFAIKTLREGFAELVETDKTDFLLSRSLQNAGVANEKYFQKIRDGYNTIAQLTAQDSNRVASLGIRLAQQTGLAHTQIHDMMIGIRGLALTVGEESETIANAIANALNGRVAELKRYGIVLDENLTKQEKYNKLVEELGKHQQTAIAYTETLAGRTEMVNEILKQAKENLVLLPVNITAKVSGVKTDNTPFEQYKNLMKLINEDLQSGKIDQQQFKALEAAASAKTKVDKKAEKRYVDARIDELPSGSRSSTGMIQERGNLARRELSDAYSALDEYYKRMEEEAQKQLEAEQKKIDKRQKQEEKEEKARRQAAAVVTELLYSREEYLEKQNQLDEKALQAAIERYAEEEQIQIQIQNYEKERSKILNDITQQENNLLKEKRNAQDAAKRVADAEGKLSELAEDEVRERERKQEYARERTLSSSQRKQAEKFERWSDEARARGNEIQAEKYAQKAYDIKHGKGAYEKKIVEEEHEKLNRKAEAVKDKKDATAEMKNVDKNAASIVKHVQQLAKRLQEIDKAIAELTKSKKGK